MEIREPEVSVGKTWAVHAGCWWEHGKVEKGGTGWR
jgi:hypothetical protein